MSSDEMKSIRVTLLGRELGLRVRAEDEDHTRKLAQYVDRRMREFQRAHPEQAELTTAMITSMALAEELYDLRAEHEDAKQTLDAELDALADELSEVLHDAPHEDQKESARRFNEDQETS